MGVYQSWQQDMLWSPDQFPRGIALRGFGGRQQIDNPAIAHHQGVIIENLSFGFDGDGPAGADDEVCRVHGTGFRRRHNA